MLPTIASVAEGPVTFEATKVGPSTQHELLVLKTDFDPHALPTRAAAWPTSSLTASRSSPTFVTFGRLSDLTEDVLFYEQAGMRNSSRALRDQSVEMR